MNSSRFSAEDAVLNAFYEDPYCNTPIVKQKLQVITFWDRVLSHDRITFNLDNNAASRDEHFEIYPIILAKCLSYTTCITFQIHSTSNFREFSFGLLALSSFMYDFNLANNIGKLEETWGIGENKESCGFQLWSNGKFIKPVPRLQDGDVVSLLLDINSEHIDNSGSDGKLYIYINQKHISTITDLDCSIEYAFGVTLSPYQQATILSTVTVTPPPSASDDMQSSPQESLGGENKEQEEENAEVPIQYKIISNRMNAQAQAKDNLNNNNNHHNTRNVSDAKVSHLVEEEIKQQQQVPVPSFFPKNQSLLAENPIIRQALQLQQQKPVASTTHGELDCCICLAASKCVLLLPCKHLCVCEVCGLNTPSVSHCPICRIRIKQRMKVYL